MYAYLLWKSYSGIFSCYSHLVVIKLHPLVICWWNQISQVRKSPQSSTTLISSYPHIPSYPHCIDCWLEMVRAGQVAATDSASGWPAAANQDPAFSLVTILPARSSTLIGRISRWRCSSRLREKENLLLSTKICWEKTFITLALVAKSCLDFSCMRSFSRAL